MKIVYLTAGAGGMFCGSCLHDNSLAKALRRLGHDALLLPLYTPIRTDQEDVSDKRLFFGGINVYLQQISPIFRFVPGPVRRWLDSPTLLRWLTARASSTSAKSLGGLTVSMLRGQEGNQRQSVQELCQFLSELQPDLVIFSNLLIAGCLPALRDKLRSCRVAVILQGDDIFYDSLIEPYRSQALQALRGLVSSVDRFLVHSHDYAERMERLLLLPKDRIAQLPLSIECEDLLSIPSKPPGDRPRSVGYLARLAPEKGLHLLVDAFIQMASRGSLKAPRLEIAGWLGPQHEAYWADQQAKLSAAGLQDLYRYRGAVDRAGKVEFLGQIDLLSVPTTYREPKGLFALEAMAAGVPYILPGHGAFPELHQRAQAGQLHRPDDVTSLAEILERMLGDEASLSRLGSAGRKFVQQGSQPIHEAQALIRLFSQS